ncbi:MAG: 1-deoxy-D-xylulose-5-phosphate synthase [Planctomycetota bacterium]|nr:1-deoxy-D-xylulose-5-phosphate synthase [Planctomycetota bacterium]
MVETTASTESSEPDPQVAPGSPVGDLLALAQSPAELKKLSEQELGALCAQMRTFLLDTVQTTGGHLGSNLGVVELTVALHYVYNFERDRLILDVSHQCYPHKLLTGRMEGFAKLRRTGGLCGFTHPEESPFDLFHTGHAGTSISLGLGLSMAGARDETPPKVVSIIGDASLGAGVAFEAINHAGASGSPMLVILNDNEWSISKSVGALSKYLSKVRSNRLVQRAGQETKSLIQAIPLIGARVDRALDDLGEVMRHAVVPGHIFEEAGVRYVGPVDGHDVNGMVEVLRKVSELDGVVILHVLTEKGKGHPDGPNHPERVHAVKPKAPATQYKTEGTPVEPRAQGVAFTKAFADSLEVCANRDVRVHAITAGMPSGTGLVNFSERFPSRFHDTGITEQHAVAMAAGMAKGGLRPVVAIYSTFLQRGFDQCFQEVALQDLPVVLALDRAGPVGQDGPTHHGAYDIAYLRTLPNFILGAPRDATDMARMLDCMLAQNHPSAIRYPRGNTPHEECLPEAERLPMQAGKAEVLREGEDVVLWAYGSMVSVALEVAATWNQAGVAVGVVDARFAKPLDEGLLEEHLRSYAHVVTLEAHQRMGGFGSAVLEAASRAPWTEGIPQARVKVLGLPDRFLEHKTSVDEQLAEAGLDAGRIVRTVGNLLPAAKRGRLERLER